MLTTEDTDHQVRKHICSLIKLKCAWLYMEDIYYSLTGNQNHNKLNPLAAMHPDVPYLLCLMPDDFTLSNMPDDFTHQGESAATQWVDQTICLCTLLTL